MTRLQINAIAHKKQVKKQRVKLKKIGFKEGPWINSRILLFEIKGTITEIIPWKSHENPISRTGVIKLSPGRDSTGRARDGTLSDYIARSGLQSGPFKAWSATLQMGSLIMFYMSKSYTIKLYIFQKEPSYRIMTLCWKMCCFDDSKPKFQVS